MGVIGLLTCEILELEFVHIFAEDRELNCVTVLEDRFSTRLIELLELSEHQMLRRIPHIHSFSPDYSGRPEVLVRVLEVALHEKKERLQNALIRAAREMNAYVDVLLLGYGVCGGAVINPRELLDVDVPVFVPIDRGQPVDDCVSLVLGGRDYYYAEQRKIAGTFFMTPGWTYHWRKFFAPEHSHTTQNMARRLLNRYKRSLLVVTPVMSRDDMERNVKDFNELFDLRLETCVGTLDLLNDAWNAAKTYLTTGIVSEIAGRN